MSQDLKLNIRQERTLRKCTTELTFESVIKDLGSPKVNKKYILRPGKLKLDKEDIYWFYMLFRPKNIYKTVGHGEVSVYWLFNEQFGGRYLVRKNKEIYKPDLQVNDFGVEIKAYSKQSNRLKLGRVNRNHQAYKVISKVVACYNLTHTDYINDGYISLRKLQGAFESFFNLLENNKSFIEQCQLRDIIESSYIKESKNPRECAVNIFYDLAMKSLQKKPGYGNYLIYINPKEMNDIYVKKIKRLDKESITDNSIHIESSSLIINKNIL